MPGLTKKQEITANIRDMKNTISFLMKSNVLSPKLAMIS